MLLLVSVLPKRIAILYLRGIPYPEFRLLGTEVARHGREFLQNIVGLLGNIAEATSGYQKSGGDQGFWMTTTKEMVGYIAIALYLSVSIINLGAMSLKSCLRLRSHDSLLEAQASEEQKQIEQGSTSYEASCSTELFATP